MGWYLAPSLAVLRAEVDTRWPRRDRTSDGTIGDAAHAATRSDHNPNDRESVNALDLDKDGIDVAEVIRAAERHPSVHYWIYRRQIADRDDGFRPRRYSGANPHDKHLHISIRQSRAAEQDRRPWGLLAGEDDTVSTADVTQGLATVVPWRSDGVARLAKAKGLSEKDSRVLLEMAWEQAALSRDLLLEVAANQATMLGKDWVNEPEIVDGVLAGLGSKDLDDAAAALRAAFGDRLPDLVALLTGAPESRDRG